MAKYSLLDLNRKLTDLQRDMINSGLTSHLAKIARDIIYLRVKSGYGVSSDSSGPDSTERVKLKPLSEEYKEMRKFIRKPKGRPLKGKGLASFFQSAVLAKSSKTNYSTGYMFSPNRSNLTLTGQLLESISFSYTNNSFKIFINNSSRTGDSLSNIEVAKYVAKERPFFALTKGEINILRRELSVKIRDIVRRLNL